MQASRFATARYRPPIIPYTGPKEPMPLKTRLATFLKSIEGL